MTLNTILWWVDCDFFGFYTGYIGLGVWYAMALSVFVLALAQIVLFYIGALP